MRMVSVPGTVVLLLVLLITLERGDAFLPIMNLYRDAGMACRWYNMPPYANAIASQGTNGGSVNYLTGLSTMLNRLYPDAFTGMGSQTRPRVVVRVEETDTLRNRNGIAVPAGTSGGNGNRELDYYYYETDPQYNYEEDGYAYDDYSDPGEYADTVTYYDMPSANVRRTGNVFQTWYGSGVNAPSTTGNTNACNVCATSALLSFLMG
ncbi:uncharacterized protein LOC118505095 isoform X1 [Anopheles stephensi]|uniref:uncharacterized protein LOC118505095 isoform X1 n=1 Tax=Anopheles stephensi TaxID=30069 RepID=UPI0007D3C749|nr:uncharacterized protein LOC118505095 isoform X1 [Anopheles stephensi]XP_035896288.1 uncharacterized protein LOC118505095 isoform X1 [Anopheles stephensi]XP_035896289.1 uncharacterized protein LOC118505095 isoform X1 [Anopheles stephensi]